MDSTVTISANSSKKDYLISLIWQHLLLLISLFIIALGVALCVRSNLGSSVISSTPLAFNLAGDSGLCPPLGPGTLFAMVYVGLAVRLIGTRLTWFDRLLLYRPGLRRTLYGLARYLRR